MFVQAIVTKYHGPTNSKGSRIKATAAAGSVTVAYDHGLNSNANHTAAAHKLATKYGWSGHYAGGGMPDGTGNVYVCTGRAPAGERVPFLSSDDFLIEEARP